MVKITVKRNDEVLFLHQATCDTLIDELIANLSAIHNGRLKVERICSEMVELAKYGTTLPPNMQGLTEEQITELKLKDEWAEKCRPHGGDYYNKDPMGRRNGVAPKEQMAKLLMKTSKEAKDMISKKKAKNDACVDMKTITGALDILNGATMIVYPMKLPPHEPIRMELENKEDLSGTQASLDIIPTQEADLWWSGKQLLRGKKLRDYIGNNEKTKIVAKVQKMGQGAPSRESVISDADQREMMAYYYKKQEDAKKLAADKEDSYMNAEWADKHALKKKFQGLSNIRY
ncbi:cilia- and flagella-associated protein 298-like [Argonauta hians]